ncbi:hypothetical protein GALMADRAFT_242279 [Galerina marginata CBS 339.88]|uniref:Uncharacterized protein n=1 Tax=Galerina marginata (strain CBS 339.88) TaxID=685588 RepID=A0A067TJH1_GALM3|nr:hypothetical protein GALMADRAFT_242279 [Galerina marginata CBS 339.88]
MPGTLLYPIYAPPIARLPVELLDEIFNLCLPQDPYLTLSDDPLKSSRVVSHVCIRWRTVALCNSRLWNEIALSKWRRMDRLPWIRELFHRSRNAPVSLRLWIGDGWNEDWDAALEPLLLGLMPRIRSLDVRMDYTLLDEAYGLIETLTGNNSPLLEFVKITPYNVCRTTLQNKASDFYFRSSMPKLKHAEYDIHFNYFPFPSLSNLTYIKMTSYQRYGGAGFLPGLCLELLRSTPLLQELYLLVESKEDDDDFPDLWDPQGVDLPHLKHLNVHLSCFDCCLLLPYVIISPGCTLDITCTDSEVGDAHEAVRYALEAHVQDTKLSMVDKLLEIDIQPASICILVHSASPIPGAENRPFFVFRSTLSLPEDDSDEEGDDGESSDSPGIQPVQYALLMLIVRAIHQMKFTEACGVSLNIEVQFPFERITAAVLGPLLRACKSAKTLRLTGSKNAFMLPFLLNRIYGTGRGFDELLFSDLDDDDDDSDWDPVALMESSFMGEACYIPVGSIPMLPNPESEALKTIGFLNTPFSVTTLDEHCHLINLLYWREHQMKIVDNLLWPVACLPTARTTSQADLSTNPLAITITMADMVHHYLKPNRPCLH